MELNTLKSTFIDTFKTEPKSLFFSPGRINLIGEHIDYNGGLVFPCPITLGTFAAARVREDRICRAYSLNFESLGIIEFSLDDLSYKKEDNWTNYLKGVLKTVIDKGYAVDKGIDILVNGTLPNGAGLSSSASLEMLMVKILDKFFSLNISKVDAALIGKEVENNYIGVNSGIMDQFAISLGEKDKAILLDCNTLYYEYAPLELEDNSIIIMNTNKRRELADSKYNERRKECDDSLDILKKYCSINSLCELSLEEFEAHKDKIDNPLKIKRCIHAISENERVKNAVNALKNKDLELFGELINQSHISLRDDYEVTGKELDTLAQEAWKQPGVLGARMTGAGFGGCAIAIVNNSKVEDFIKNVGEAYKEAIGYEASFYIASIGNGPTEL
ncbi:galactokinase [Clostridium sp. B9]|uniref:galactokinase n=1 Tax=Clostridium sp. B9 TaxID=3423224 RepID=UPI003D2EADA0